MDDDQIEILDVENYKGGGQLQFSHQILVMRVMNKCIEAGTKEMRSGYYNEKADRFGNKIMTYVPDTRKEFIENVKTAEMIMVCDLDDDAIKNISEIKKELKKEFEKLCGMERMEWESLGIKIKRDRWSKGIFQQRGTLNMKLPYYQEYLEFEVDCYRRILAELTQLTKRLDFYQEEDWEA